MSKLFVSTILAGLLLALPGQAVLQAQQNEFVRFPKGDATWTVLLKKRGAANSAIDRNEAEGDESAGPGVGAGKVLRSVEVTRTEALTRSVLYWSDGKSTESWWVEKPSKMALMDAGKQVVATDLLFLFSEMKPDELLFRWVSPDCLVGETMARGKRCYEFKKEVLDLNQPMTYIPGVPKPSSKPNRAWIEIETGLPVALDDGNTRYLFEFAETPRLPLVLPERFQAELTRIEEADAKPRYLGKPRSWQSTKR